MKTKKGSTEPELTKLTKDEKDLLLKNKLEEIEENKVKEKIFSGSCCHSGIHAYNGKM